MVKHDIVSEHAPTSGVDAVDAAFLAVVDEFSLPSHNAPSLHAVVEVTLEK